VVMKTRAGAITLGCLFWLLVVAAGVYFGIPAASKYMKYTRYRDIMAAELNVRAKLPDWQLRNRFKVLADSLGLPEDAGIVTIVRKQGRITVTAHYEETIDLPGFKKEIHFEPKAAASY
jgi:hypothetical protein